MMPLPIVTASEEGGLYALSCDASKPIRIYADRWVEDDILARFTGQKRRERLSQEKFERIMMAAAENRKQGLV